MITALADADFIFRIRCQPTTETLDRRIIRGDRTLAIRHPNYSKADSEIIAKSYPEVYDIIREGRIRFIVTQGPRHDKDKDWQESDFEIKLAHQAMVANQKDYVHLY